MKHLDSCLQLNFITFDEFLKPEKIRSLKMNHAKIIELNFWREEEAFQIWQEIKSTRRLHRTYFHIRNVRTISKYRKSIN